MDRKSLLARRASLLEKREACLKAQVKAAKETLILDGSIAMLDQILKEMPVEEPAAPETAKV